MTDEMDTERIEDFVHRALRGVRVVAGGAVAGVVVLAPALAAAQQELSEAAKETSIPGGQLMIVSYIVLWLGLFGYVGYLGVRQRNLDEEIDELEGRIDRALADFDDDQE